MKKLASLLVLSLLAILLSSCFSTPPSTAGPYSKGPSGQDENDIGIVENVGINPVYRD